MKKKDCILKVLSILWLSIICCMFMGGCSSSTDNNADNFSSNQQNTLVEEGKIENESIDELINPLTDNETNDSLFASDVDTNYGIAAFIQIELRIINKCGATIGMLSMIDPISGEQLNLSKLEDDNVLTLSLNWPKEENILKWALYNSLGELCVEMESDLTGITKSADIEILGNGDVEDIEINVE